jgi:archaellum biogenesis protein FlaJ (TadC family)
MLKFSRHALHLLHVFAFVFSTLILGAILIWAPDHTDIVAFVTVLVAGTAIETVLIFSLFKATPVPENDVAYQRADEQHVGRAYFGEDGKAI